MSKEEIYNRRSIRKYREEALPIEVVAEILDAGRMAPSGSNRQPWKFLVFAGSKKEKLLAVMEAGIKRERIGEKRDDKTAKMASYFSDPRYGYYVNANTLHAFRTAPVVILVVNPNGRDPFGEVTFQERISEMIDTLSIGGAVENMLLRAQEMGIGSLWAAVTFWAYQELTEYLGEQGHLMCAVALGYANEAPAQRSRKGLKDIVEYYVD